MPIVRCEETRIGRTIFNGERSKVAVSIFDRDSTSLMQSFESGTRDLGSLYEIRYDMFSNRSPSELEKILKYLNHYGVDYIFTFRSSDEAELLEYYGIASDLGVPAADVEIAVFDRIRKNLTMENLIISHHSFTGNSIIPEYRNIVEKSPAIIKLASRYNDYGSFQADLQELQNLKEKNRTCLSFIPMGRENSFLRVISAYVVSDLVYARETGETGEGQLTESDYMKFFEYF